MIDFIRQIHPVNDKYLSFHVDNLFLIFVITGCQKDCFVGLPPTTNTQIFDWYLYCIII